MTNIMISFNGFTYLAIVVGLVILAYYSDNDASNTILYIGIGLLSGGIFLRLLSYGYSKIKNRMKNKND